AHHRIAQGDLDLPRTAHRSEYHAALDADLDDHDGAVHRAFAGGLAEGKLVAQVAGGGVDAPVRISTPGHLASGADGVGECDWATPGVASEKKLKLANRLANEGELSDDPTLEASEQPDSIAALTISAAAQRGPRRAKSK